MDYSPQLENMINTLAMQGENPQLRVQIHAQAVAEGVDIDEVDMIINARIKKARRGELSMTTPPPVQSVPMQPQSVPAPPPPPPVQNVPPQPRVTQPAQEIPQPNSAHQPAYSGYSADSFNGSNSSNGFDMKKILVFAGIGLCFLVVIIGGIYMFTRNSSSPSDEVATTEVTPKETDIVQPDLVDGAEEPSDIEQEMVDAKDDESWKNADKIVEEAMKNINSEEATADGDVEGIYPEASQRLLTDADLVGKSKLDLKMMRNEIFARHGYIFKTKDMKEHFEHQYWYEGKYNDVSSMLTSIEKKNVELIKKYENR